MQVQEISCENDIFVKINCNKDNKQHVIRIIEEMLIQENRGQIKISAIIEESHNEHSGYRIHFNSDLIFKFFLKFKSLAIPVENSIHCLTTNLIIHNVLPVSKIRFQNYVKKQFTANNQDIKVFPIPACETHPEIDSGMWQIVLNVPDFDDLDIFRNQNTSTNGMFIKVGKLQKKLTFSCVLCDGMHHKRSECPNFMSVFPNSTSVTYDNTEESNVTQPGGQIIVVQSEMNEINSSQSERSFGNTPSKRPNVDENVGAASKRNSISHQNNQIDIYQPSTSAHNVNEIPPTSTNNNSNEVFSPFASNYLSPSKKSTPTKAELQKTLTGFRSLVPIEQKLCSVSKGQSSTTKPTAETRSRINKLVSEGKLFNNDIITYLDNIPGKDLTKCAEELGLSLDHVAADLETIFEDYKNHINILETPYFKWLRGRMYATLYNNEEVVETIE